MLGPIRPQQIPTLKAPIDGQRYIKPSWHKAPPRASNQPDPKVPASISSTPGPLGPDSIANSQKRAPYYEALLAYTNRRPTEFQTPGHVEGQGMDARMHTLLNNAARFDRCQMAELGNLVQRTGPLGEALHLASEAAGSEQTYFFPSGGSSQANQVALMSLLNDNDEVIVPRSAHCSLYSSLWLTGAKPIYVPAEIDQEWNLPLPISHEAAQKALNQHPNAKALFIQSPTYNGIHADLTPIIAQAHERNIPVVVDQAWAAHFRAHHSFPQDAVAAGADLVIESTHKMLPSLTGTAQLHVQGVRIDRAALNRAFKRISSTSPNTISICSLDITRSWLQTSGVKQLRKAAYLATTLRRDLAAIDGIEVFTLPPSQRIDPLKVTFRIQGYSGVEAFHAFQHEGVVLEMHDDHNLLAIVNISSSPRDLKRLIQVAKNFSKRPPTAASRIPNQETEAIPLPPARYTPRAAAMYPTEHVLLDDALGRIAQEQIYRLPPGIPFITEGEEITAQALQVIKGLVHAQVPVHGLHDGKLAVIARSTLEID